MSRLVKIEEGVVTNVAIGDEIDGYIAANDEVAIGWTYDAGVFSPPELPQTPEETLPRRIAGAYFRAALRDMGEFGRVQAALTGPVDLELFNTATEFSESAADVNAVATALSIDLGAVFDAAEAIRAARQG